MPDFAHLLNVNADTVKEVPVLPQGTYIARVGKYEFKEAKTKDGPKPVLDVELILTSRISGEGPLPPKLPTKNHTFWLTNNDGTQDEYTLDPLLKFLQAAGVKTKDRQIGECLPEVSGNSVAVTITHSPNPKNPDRPYSNIPNNGFAQA